MAAKISASVKTDLKFYSLMKIICYLKYSLLPKPCYLITHELIELRQQHEFCYDMALFDSGSLIHSNN